MLEGPTGAGKSSIIDAIVWVLYGTTAHESANSVKQSTSGRVRSDYVGTDEETKVIMEFSSQGRRYRIQRTPTYMATKSRGEGEKKVDASARLEFIKPVAESLTRLDEVGSRVRDILGMDRAQFSQLVVLPQGDFAAFLHSSSDERRKILQSIFKTYFYEDMEAFFERKRKEHSENLRGLNAEISRHVQNLEQEMTAGSERDLQHAMAVFLDPNESDLTKLDLITTIIEELTPNIEQDEQERNRLEAELNPIKEQITRLLDSQKLIADKAVNLEKLQNLSAQQNFIDDLAEKLILREKVVPIGADLENRELAGQAIEKAEKGKLKEYPEATPKEISALISKQKIEHESLLKKTSKNEDLEALLIAARSQLAEIEKQEEAKLNLKRANSEIPKTRKKIDVLKTSISDMRLIEKNEYAYLVAKKLKSGSACPVCGSKEHPNPLKSDGTFNSAKLEGLEDEIIQLREFLTNMESLKTEANQTLEKELPTKAHAKAELESLEKRSANSVGDLAALKEVASVLKNFEDALPHYVEKERAQKEYVRFDTRILKALEDLEVTEDSLRAMLNLDPVPVLEQIDKHKSDLMAVETFLALEEVKKLPAPEGIQEELDRLKNSATESQQALDIIINRLAIASKTLKNLGIADSGIKDAISSIKAEKMLANPYLDLDAWVSGKNDLGLTLSNYVLQERLEMVLERASNHLRKISHGKYEFRLNEERVARKRIAGLGIQIMDYRAGKVRLAETLSGGETFYASLALALGLAEVVKAEEGDLELGTLFIDEGFGSLSDETLSEVIDVLEELRSADRIIGIISHVEGMKTQIPLRIEVRASEEGPSTIRFATAGMN
jgi:exonuclease SbcC